MPIDDIMGQIQITYSCDHFPIKGTIKYAKLSIMVSDDGNGMSDDELKRHLIEVVRRDLEIEDKERIEIKDDELDVEKMLELVERKAKNAKR